MSHPTNELKIKFLELKSFKQLTQIQTKVMSPILKGKDIIAISKTGTGKTYAYLLPSLNRINTQQNRTQVMIICPTQELVEQTYEFAMDLETLFPDVRILKLTKLTDTDRINVNDFPHMIIGTLGKLKSIFLEKQQLRIDHIQTLIIDEADMMLDPKNLLELDELSGKMPKQLQTLVFSATIPNQLTKFMKQYMHQAQVIKIELDEVFNPRIEHHIISVKENSQKKLLQLMDHINPALCLIFLQDNDELELFEKLFRTKNIEFVSLHGKLSPRERHQALKQIKDGRVQYILSTDVAARGLDLEMATDVISIGLPSELSFYTHRSGRIGRAGKSGRSFLLYTDKDDRGILKLMDMGLHFIHESVGPNGFKQLRSYVHQHKVKPSELDIEITKMIKGRSKKVKPGYKKKLTQEIDSIKRKRKRQLIQASIKAQQKEKSKLQQKEKTGR